MFVIYFSSELLKSDLEIQQGNSNVLCTKGGRSAHLSQWPQHTSTPTVPGDLMVLGMGPVHTGHSGLRLQIQD